MSIYFKCKSLEIGKRKKNESIRVRARMGAPIQTRKNCLSVNSSKSCSMGRVQMEVFEAIKRRHSVRAYLSDEVPSGKLARILEAARLAPSAGNIQPWHFIVVTDQQKRKKLSKGRFAKFLVESPVVLVGCGDKKASPNWYKVDTVIAIQNMVLTATSEGLGTCWIGSFNEDHVRKLLGIPERFGVIALLALGYRRETADLASKVLHFFRRKKKMEKIVSLEEFGRCLFDKEKTKNTIFAS